MTATLTLYTHPWSRGRMARWMLEECGAAYEVHTLDYGTTMKAPGYTALNPMGKVPTLRHGDAVVTETAAICAYLADQFPAQQLAPPADSAERATYYRWLFFAAGPVEAAVTAKSLGLLAPADKRAQAGYGSYEDVLATLEHACRQALARGGFLCGQFSAADLYLAGQLGWGLQFKSIEARPVFAQYSAPILARPACVRASALDDALAEQLQNQAN
jgi:glutathione S-transferase